MFGSSVVAIGSQRALLCFVFVFPRCPACCLAISPAVPFFSWMTTATLVNVGYTNTPNPVAAWSPVPCVHKLRVMAPFPFPLVEDDGTSRNAFVFPSYEPLRSFIYRRERSCPLCFLFLFHLPFSTLAGEVIATLDAHTASRFARCVGLSAASFLHPPSALWHGLSRPEAVDFVPQRPFADSASANLIVVLASLLPARYCVDCDDLCYLLRILCITFARSE